MAPSLSRSLAFRNEAPLAAPHVLLRAVEAKSDGRPPGRHRSGLRALLVRELVFDSQLITYRRLGWLSDKGISFLTLRRRTTKMLGRSYSLPASMWARVNLRSLPRKYRTPRVLDEKVRINVRGYDAELRQLSVVDLGHE